MVMLGIWGSGFKPQHLCMKPLSPGCHKSSQKIIPSQNYCLLFITYSVERQIKIEKKCFCSDSEFGKYYWCTNAKMLIQMFLFFLEYRLNSIDKESNYWTNLWWNLNWEGPIWPLKPPKWTLLPDDYTWRIFLRLHKNETGKKPKAICNHLFHSLNMKSKSKDFIDLVEKSIPISIKDVFVIWMVKKVDRYLLPWMVII